MVSPTGEVVARLPDERPGTLIVDVPIAFEIQPVSFSDVRGAL